MKKKATEDILLPWQTDEFKAAWEEWMQFRRERRLPAYVPTGLKRTLTGLVRDAGNDQGIAIAIISQSIEKNWQGLHPLKPTANGIGQGNTAVGKPGTSAARIDRAKNW